jgi:hypothetical protein
VKGKRRYRSSGGKRGQARYPRMLAQGVWTSSKGAGQPLGILSRRERWTGSMTNAETIKPLGNEGRCVSQDTAVGKGMEGDSRKLMRQTHGLGKACPL